MLSESFLRTAVYRELIAVEEQKDGEKEKSLEKTLGGLVSDRRERALEPLNPSDPSGAPSQALSIPRREGPSNVSLDLYTSWSSRCGSIYKNYPDLHIAGDHVLHKVVDSGCILDADCEDGPVLLSADIDSSSPPNENHGGLLKEGMRPSLDSHILPSAPCSNSVLNGFIEKKMQELYKLCYEENLTSGASPHPLLWPTILMHNVHQISLQISQEQNMDHAKVKEAMLQSLCSATSGGSSEFITPILHISQDAKTKPAVPSGNSMKSGRVLSKQ